MRPDIETATFFGRVALALDLTDKQKELAWSMMTKAGVGNGHPESVFFAILSKMDGLSSETLSRFADDGQALVANLRAAMTDEMRTQLEALPASLSKQLDDRMVSFVEQLASNVDLAITKEARRRQSFRTGSLVVGAAVLTMLAAGGGYVAGKDAINAQAAKWEALVNLPDGATWLNLARWNDIDKVKAQACGPSDGAVISGSQVCALPLFTSQPVATSKGADYVKLSAAEYAVKLGWLGYGLAALAGGLVVGVLGRLRRT
ncbi:hypothetical protein [Ensifer sp. B1-9]|uniref:hypothetical protein n=1 Tax=Ensifer sp. B1-9 TaxID=3141455 RepID=UPI003D1FBDA6